MPLDLQCPVCGSEDILGRKPVAGRIPLSCQACGHLWERRPPPVCASCGSKDVEVGPVHDSWAYDDDKEARENTTASWTYIDKEVYCCRRCNRRWERVFGSAPPPGQDAGVREFIDDDTGYLRWLRDHYRGFVLNCDRQPRAEYLVLHRADCWTIGGTPPRGSRWTGDYRKMCAMAKADLVAWADKKVGGPPKPCGTCMP